MWFFPQETGVVCIVYVGWTENMVTSNKMLFAIKYEFYPKTNELHPKRNVVKYPDKSQCCLRETDFAFSQIFHSLRVTWRYFDSHVQNTEGERWGEWTHLEMQSKTILFWICSNHPINIETELDTKRKLLKIQDF